MGLFHIDSPVMRGLSVLANLILLNWLFLLGCVPVVTAGASLTAMHRVVLQIIRGQETSVAHSFFSAFKSNFKQATGMWLIFLALGGVLAADFMLGPQVLSGSAWYVVLAAAAVLCVLWLMAWIYAFPLQARYENPVARTLKNALVIAAANLPNTIILAALFLAPLYLCWRFEKLLPLVLLLSMFCLFSGVTWICDLLINRIFLKTFPEERRVQEEWKRQE